VLEPPHSIRSAPHAYLRLLAGDRRRARRNTAPARRTLAAADRLPAT